MWVLPDYVNSVTHQLNVFVSLINGNMAAYEKNLNGNMINATTINARHSAVSEFDFNVVID